MEEGSKPGSNHPVEIAATELGPLYKLALEQNMKPPRHAGEIAITEWLAQELRQIGGQALVVYENGRIPGMLAHEGIAGTVAVATTRNLLELAQREGFVASAETLWAKNHRGSTNCQSRFRSHYHQPVVAMTTPVHPAIRRYAAGEISAAKAADRLGEKANVADVFVMTRQAGLPPPRPPREREHAELAHALKVLGLSNRA